MMSGGSAFQFHKGTIRTWLHWRSEDNNRHFNSIKVQLEQSLFFLFVVVVRYFNSIKVQLELDLPDNIVTTILLFQFHKGTIRTT